MLVTSKTSPLDVAARTGAVAAGLVVGVGLSSLRGLMWPWLVALTVAGVGLALRRRYPSVLWLALGVAGGAIGYIALGLALSASGAPSTGSGGVQ